MAGNVWEWVQDKFTGYGNVGTDNPIYEGFRYQDIRVIRGGSFENHPGPLRCSWRSQAGQGGMNSVLGFRLVRVQ